MATSKITKPLGRAANNVIKGAVTRYNKAKRNLSEGNIGGAFMSLLFG